MREPTEDELRAAYEEEMKRLRVEDVVVQTTVSLMNLGARKAGLAPGSEGERDLAQVQMAIEGARALLPLVEPQLGPNAAPIRDALSQLQLAYAQLVAEDADAPGAARRPGCRRRSARRRRAGARQPDDAAARAGAAVRAGSGSRGSRRASRTAFRPPISLRSRGLSRARETLVRPFPRRDSPSGGASPEYGGPNP